jgi:hypothetical protein
MSATDAVDGSSTGTEVSWMWVLLRPPRFGGAKHAPSHPSSVHSPADRHQAALLLRRLGRDEPHICPSVGRSGVEQLLDVVADASDKRLPQIARACLLALGAQLRTLKVQILNFDRQIMTWHRSNEAASGSMRSRALVPRWPPLWSPASLIRRLSDLAGISRPGSGSCRSNTRAAVRTSSAVSANKAIVICAAYSPLARWP